MKTIDTLIPDIQDVIKGKEGWTPTVTQFLSDSVAKVAEDKFSKPQEPRGNLRLSSLGRPARQLWYQYNDPEGQEELSAEALGTFFYGDLLEALLLSLVKASGHKIEGLQQTLDVYGVPGHGDAIIDGMVVDIKSASTYGFEKFKRHKLKEDDPFHYISQLSSYLAGYKDDNRVLNKDTAAFLVIEKQRFKLCLDVYNLKEEVDKKAEEVAKAKEVVAGPMPERCYEPEPEGKSGNMKLCTACSYCGWRKKCWPEARTFLYSTGLKHLVDVRKTPLVPEIKNDQSTE